MAVKTLLRAAAALTLALGWSGAAIIPARADIDVDKVSRAVVFVVINWKGAVIVPFQDGTTQTYPSTATGNCTGWIMDDVAHIATAGHCVTYEESVREAMISNLITSQFPSQANSLDVKKLDWQVVPEKTPTVQVLQPNVIANPVFDDRGTTAQLIDSQEFEAQDNALLQVASKSTAGVGLRIASNIPKVRDKVTIVGFPAETGEAFDATRQAPSFKEASVSAPVVSKKGVPKLQLDGEVISGMSGGPTMNQDGEVVGINSGSFTNQNQSYITTTDAMRAFYEKNGVKGAGSAAPAAGGSSAASSSASGAAGQPAPVANSRGDSPAVAPASDNSSLIIWIVVLAAIVVIALGGLAFFFLRSRQRDPSIERISRDEQQD
ncbi:S1 family peptidase [Sinomonas soli]